MKITNIDTTQKAEDLLSGKIPVGLPGGNWQHLTPQEIIDKVAEVVKEESEGGISEEKAKELIQQTIVSGTAGDGLQKSIVMSTGSWRVNTATFKIEKGADSKYVGYLSPIYRIPAGASFTGVRGVHVLSEPVVYQEGLELGAYIKDAGENAGGPYDTDVYIVYIGQINTFTKVDVTYDGVDIRPFTNIDDVVTESTVFPMLEAQKQIEREIAEIKEKQNDEPSAAEPAYRVVEHTDPDLSVSADDISSPVIYECDTLLSISLPDTKDSVNELVIFFSSGSTPTSISVPNSNTVGALKIEAGKRYVLTSFHGLVIAREITTIG